jgi:hypothetical protein
MKRFLCLMIFVLSLTVHASSQSQSQASAQVIPLWLPHPYVGLGVSLMPNGYSPIAFRAQGGLYWDYKHLVSDAFGAIDNGKKSNDGTLYNIHGHDDYANGFLALRPRDNTYFGVGSRWSQLITSNYTKGTNLFQAVRDGDFRLQAIVGRDWKGTTNAGKRWMVRGQVNYVFSPFHEFASYPAISTSSASTPASTCNGCGNGVQGPEFTLFFPSPAISKHWIFQETVGIYEFHDTYTIAGGYPGERKRHGMATTDFVIRYRF